MNEHPGDAADDGHDEAMRELFAPLRRLGPGVKGQVAARQAVAAELARASTAAVPQSKPWARLRRLAALACALAVGVGVGWAARGAAAVPGVTVAATAEDGSAVKESTVGDGREAKAAAAADEPVLAYYARETYLSGVGRLSFSSGYRFQE